MNVISEETFNMLKAFLGTLENKLLHKINQYLFFGEKNVNYPMDLSLPTAITFQELTVLFSYNLYVYNEIDLSYSNLNDKKLAFLTNALENDHCCRSRNILEDVDLSDNDIGALGIANFLEVLYSPYIRSLYLGYNDIGQKGEKYIANILNKSKTKLETLSLCSTNMDDGCGNYCVF